MIASAHEIGATVPPLMPPLPPADPTDRQPDHPDGSDRASMTLADIMTVQVTTVPADYSVHWARTVMRGERISALVVVDADRPVGIFTERDAVRFASSHRDADVVPVSEAMGSPPITAPADMGFRQAYQLINTHGVRHLIVTDQAGRLAGIVSEADFIHHLAAADLLAARDVGAVMTQGAVGLPEDSLVRDAVRLMAGQHLGCVVVERHGHPIGILTERDLVRLGDEEIDFATTKLTKVMSHPVHTVSAAESLPTAISRMEHAQTRRLVVVDDDGATVGIVTRHDIVKVLRDA
ncbi:CBS domain-containing protein [uncultured Thiodictyon sp.]|uniref:CBS domain-containing protein n=1 Tax=uncultured Thiodictyon sp. TaxID=1846217 RepID=UPI0025D86815|nr:CBS domain-containing protein [uncultured Thiodictyon sp.]